MDEKSFLFLKKSVAIAKLELREGLVLGNNRAEFTELYLGVLSLRTEASNSVAKISVLTNVPSHQYPASSIVTTTC